MGQVGILKVVGKIPPKGFWGPAPPLLFSFPAIKWSVSLCHNVLPQSQSNRANQSWIETCEIVSHVTLAYKLILSAALDLFIYLFSFFLIYCSVGAGNQALSIWGKCPLTELYSLLILSNMLIQCCSFPNYYLLFFFLFCIFLLFWMLQFFLPLRGLLSRVVCMCPWLWGLSPRSFTCEAHAPPLSNTPKFLLHARQVVVPILLHTSLCAYMYISVQKRPGTASFLRSCLPCFLRQDFSLAWNSSSRLGWTANSREQTHVPVSDSPVLRLQGYISVPDFFHGLCGSSSGFHACVARILWLSYLPSSPLNTLNNSFIILKYLFIYLLCLGVLLACGSVCHVPAMPVVSGREC